MGHIVALSGGVGGAKLAYGLSRVLAPGDLTVAVNTADDFEHLGLTVCPDIDTVAYTLSDLADRERGWGLAGETWNFMAALKRLGGEDWFLLGDHDLAMHVERTRRLAAGETLSQVTADLTRRLGIGCAIVPMSDDPLRTVLDTDQGRLAFQHYFVRERCAPVVSAIHFEGEATIAPGFAAALAKAEAVILCPSNPYLSVDPILAVRGVREAIGSPCIAVSPIVGGKAIKGPTAKLMAELGVETTQGAIAAHYRGLIDALVIDESDRDAAAEVEAQGVRALVAPTVMLCDDTRIALARACLEAIG
jgi:LPPG:FO 2-phospho-L-lactate transferase